MRQSEDRDCLVLALFVVLALVVMVGIVGLG
jgi:hypothetical protein